MNKRKNLVDQGFTVKVPDISKFRRKCAYTKPKEVTYFSFDEDRILQLQSRESLSYYSPKSLPLDLNQGFKDRYITRDTAPEGIASLVQSVKNIEHNSNFCTWRGIMTKIICTPYQQKDDWELQATLKDGTIYLREVEDLNKDKFGKYDNDKLFTYYGYNFETLFTSDQERDGKQQETNQEKVTNTNIQFCSVFQSKLGSHSLLLGGEVDCLYKHPTNNDYQMQYVELKTHKVMTTNNHHKSFKKFKLLKTWAQSYLAGVPRIIFGFRDQKGYVRETKEYLVEEFPRMVRDEALWDPNVCLSFGDFVLALIKDKVVIDDPEVCYNIKYSSGVLAIGAAEKGDVLNSTCQ